jgi:hypothetical protein
VIDGDHRDCDDAHHHNEERSFGQPSARGEEDDPREVRPTEGEEVLTLGRDRKVPPCPSARPLIGMSGKKTAVTVVTRT